MNRPRVVLGHRLTDADPGRLPVASDGVLHAEVRVSPLAAADRPPEAHLRAVSAAVADGPGGERVRLLVSVGRDDPVETVRSLLGSPAVRDPAVVGVVLEAGPGPSLDRPGAIDGHLDALRSAADLGLGVVVDLAEHDGADGVARVVDRCPVDRIGFGPALLAGAARADGRLRALGPAAARVRDARIPVDVGRGRADGHAARLLFDAGVAVVADDLAALAGAGFDDVELAACAERAAAAAFLPDAERDRLVGEVRAGWDVRPARLVHLAERARWEARGAGPYLPAEFARDGFVHLSALHQLLTPANRFYRGRDDLVAVVLDAHLLGRAVVWEAGTGAVERFPHLYGAIDPDAVLAEVAFPPGADGGFLLPVALVRAVQGASASRGSSPNSRRSVP